MLTSGAKGIYGGQRRRPVTRAVRFEMQMQCGVYDMRQAVACAAATASPDAVTSPESV